MLSGREASVSSCRGDYALMSLTQGSDGSLSERLIASAELPPSPSRPRSVSESSWGGTSQSSVRSLHGPAFRDVSMDQSRCDSVGTSVGGWGFRRRGSLDPFVRAGYVTFVSYSGREGAQSVAASRRPP